MKNLGLRFAGAKALSKDQMKNISGGNDVSGSDGCPTQMCRCYYGSTTWTANYSSCDPSDEEILADYYVHCGKTQAECFEPL